MRRTFQALQDDFVPTSVLLIYLLSDIKELVLPQSVSPSFVPQMIRVIEENKGTLKILLCVTKAFFDCLPEGLELDIFSAATDVLPRDIQVVLCRFRQLRRSPDSDPEHQALRVHGLHAEYANSGVVHAHARCGRDLPENPAHHDAGAFLPRRAQQHATEEA